jgi:agmatine deiminase
MKKLLDSGVSVKYRAISEWTEPQGIYIVNPEAIFFSKRIILRDLLVKFYNEFLYYLIDYTKVNIIICDKLISVDTSVPFESVNVIHLPTVKDIWIRDWAPILAKDEAGNITAMKFIYSPAYLSKTEAKSGNISGKLLAQMLKIPVVNVPLILDGGNFTHNGEGIGIVSNRVISNNENYSITEIKNIFLQYLGIDKLIFIPVEPGDVTGHTDGMVRFVDNKTLLVGDYPDEYEDGKDIISFEEYEESKNHTSKLIAMLKSEHKKDFKVIRMTNTIPRNPMKKNDFPSAFGNYVNFIRLGKTILLPQYNIQEDVDAVRVLKKNCKDLNIIPVDIFGINELSNEGGVFNCISWIKY